MEREIGETQHVKKKKVGEIQCYRKEDRWREKKGQRDKADREKEAIGRQRQRERKTNRWQQRRGR